MTVTDFRGTPELSDLLPCAAVARRSGISRHRLLGYAAVGEIRAVTVGAEVRLSLSDALRIAERNAAPAGAA